MEKQRVPDDLSPTRKAYIQKQYSVDLGLAQWEIDFFWKSSFSKKRGTRRIFAAKENRRAAQISLILEISRTYLKLAADMENLKIAEQLLDTAKKKF